MSNFEKYAPVYDLIYSAKDYAKETAFVARQLRKYNSIGKSILDIGCGTGGHLKHFVNLGLDAYGIDRSPGMIELAQKKFPEISNHFRVGNATLFPADRAFDYVVSLFHVLSYQVTDIEIKSFLKTIAGHMSNDSVALFDYWFTPAVLKQGTYQTIKQFIMGSEKVIRTSTPENSGSPSTVDVHIKIEHFNDGRLLHSFEEKHPMRSFELREIQEFCTEAGLSVIHHGAWEHDSAAPDENCWSAYSIVKKASK